MIGGTFVLYYAANVAGTADECISVATASQPQGPFHDTSTAPLECQKSLGGSIDPASFIDTDGTQYLVWKSGGPGTSRIWSQPLVPSGTAFVPATNPTSLLVPDQPWEAGTVEAPDLVTTGGHYYPFYSGNNWNSSNYAVGAATCTGPLGPCSDASPNPILSSGSGVAGPGGESVFAGTAGHFWIAFHAWVPGVVGFPNSRDLYLRRLTFSGPVPTVATPG
jgi:beta-xylosidase